MNLEEQLKKNIFMILQWNNMSNYLWIFLMFFIIACGTNAHYDEDHLEDKLAFQGQYTKLQIHRGKEKGVRIKMQYLEGKKKFFGRVENISDQTFCEFQIMASVDGKTQLQAPEKLNLSPGRASEFVFSVGEVTFRNWAPAFHYKSCE